MQGRVLSQGGETLEVGRGKINGTSVLLEQFETPFMALTPDMQDTVDAAPSFLLAYQGVGALCLRLEGALEMYDEAVGEQTQRQVEHVSIDAAIRDEKKKPHNFHYVVDEETQQQLDALRVRLHQQQMRVEKGAAWLQAEIEFFGATILDALSDEMPETVGINGRVFEVWEGVFVENVSGVSVVYGTAQTAVKYYHAKTKWMVPAQLAGFRFKAAPPKDIKVFFDDVQSELRCS